MSSNAQDSLLPHINQYYNGFETSEAQQKPSHPTWAGPTLQLI